MHANVLFFVTTTAMSLVFLLIILITLCEKRTDRLVWSLFVLICFGVTCFANGVLFGEGQILKAESNMFVGDMYTLITHCEQYENKFYAVVKINDNTICGLYFKEPPPKRGVVVKRNHEIIFLPLPDSNEESTPKK